jgi:beta-phosphoglucomutase-like phosphatase (HAD superfamily)
LTGRVLAAGIFDVDGVLLASPHERAWRDALPDPAARARFTTALYQAHVAGKPRLAGAAAALVAVGLAHDSAHVDAYAERKQAVLEQLIGSGGVTAFPDALRFVQAVAGFGWPLAVASSSKNANQMLQAITLPNGESLLSLFKGNTCGRDLPAGKPNPEIFLLAAASLHMDPAVCFVVEDAGVGIQAAHAGGMAGLGVARWGDQALLAAADADLVVTSLDDVSLDALFAGRLSRRAA